MIRRVLEWYDLSVMPPLAGVVYDESNWPIVLVTMPPVLLTERDFVRHLERLSSYYTRGEPFGFVIDVRQGPQIPAEQRRLIAERADRDRERYPNLMCGNAIVISSAFQRGIIHVLAWLVNRPYPMEAFSSTEAASAWLRGLIADTKKPRR